MTDCRSAARRIGIAQRQQGQPVGEAAAAVMRRDGSLDQQRERTASLGDLDGAAGVPDLLDREGVHPRAILHLIAESDLSV